MKKIVLLVITFLVIGNVFSQGIEFEHGTFNEALAKAKKENKLLFMDCYTSWCAPCKWMMKDIFPQQEVGDFFNKNFVNFKIDMEKGEGVELRQKYQVRAFPTLFFLDAEGKEVYKIVGAKPAGKLIAGAKCALDPNLRIGVLRDKFKNGNREYDFLLIYLTAVNRRYDKLNTLLVSKALIENYSLEKFLTKDLFYVIRESKLKYGSKEYQYLLKNKESILAKVDAEEYKKVIDNAIKIHLNKYVSKCESLSDLNKEIERCKKDGESSNQKYLEKSLICEYYLSKGEFNKWFDEKLAEIEKFKGKPNYVSMLRHIGNTVVRDPRFNGSIALERALKMGHDITAIDDGIIGNFLLAKLYLKDEDKEKALKYFNLFFENNEKAGGNNICPSVSNIKNAIDNL